MAKRGLELIEDAQEKYQRYLPMMHRTFISKTTNDETQALMLSFDDEKWDDGIAEALVTYCYVRMPWLKFTVTMEFFLECFEDKGVLK